ncbi:MAG TPA: L-threonylcarbamoyladenylate synthase [Chloroflexia bacterium]|nr:L-threonylcarbamoyladenylate synthase [Chloroflexia bacterium]
MKTLVTDNIEEAAALLRAGETVIFPTETVYGLGADATNPAAVAKIYEAKQRPSDNPLIVHIWQREQVEQLAKEIPPYAYDLMEAFFPGPFTILLPKRSIIPDATTAGSSKVCLRMPSLPEAQEFLKASGLPVAAPSANLSGRPSPTRWQDCLEDMDGRVSCILKGPEASFGLESTIVDASGSQPVLMRPGGITLEQLAQVVPDILPQPGKNAPTTPGMKYRHYAPHARVSLLDEGEKPAENSSGAAYIGLDEPSFETSYHYRASSLEDYGRNLFSFFRECDRRGIEHIYAEKVASHGYGRAIMNRLQKASANH